MLDNIMERRNVPNRPLSDTINEMNCANSCSGFAGTNMIAMIMELIMENSVKKAIEKRIGCNKDSIVNRGSFRLKGNTGDHRYCRCRNKSHCIICFVVVSLRECVVWVCAWRGQSGGGFF